MKGGWALTAFCIVLTAIAVNTSSARDIDPAFLDQGPLVSLPPLPPAPPPPPWSVPRLLPGAKVNLPGHLIYIYSFLDVREREFSRRVLDQINADLAARFHQASIETKLLQFKESSVGEGFAAASGREGYTATLIPVRETVFSNRNDEEATKAGYRLLIFPSDFSISGAWRFYEINWILEDIARNGQVWRYTYSGRHLAMIKESENSQARSRKIVDALFEEMNKRGILKPE